MTLERREAVAERAARAGASVALEQFRSDLAVETKSGKTDVVTQADRDAQARVVEVIRDSFPEEAIIGEEGGGVEAVPSSGAVWVVDPIDGTSNYVRGSRTWATSVAVIVDGEPVAAATILPAEGDSYLAGQDPATLNGDPISVSDRRDPETFVVVPMLWWPTERRGEYAAAFEAIVTRFGDARRVGCAQGTLAMLASGQIEGIITTVRGNPWDTVAGVHLVEQAGGTVTDVAGETWHPESKGLVASNGRAHDRLLSAVRDVLAVES
ncbi:MAG: inositol monophosphatase [Halodesulfurarchaeum sp.]